MNKGGLYVCNASEFGLIGTLVNLKIITDPDYGGPCYIKSLNYCKDEFGDDEVDVTLSVPFWMREVPIQKIAYKATAGRTGFDADKISEWLLGSLLKDGFVWDDTNKALVAVSSIGSDLIHVLGSMRDPVITYHTGANLDITSDDKAIDAVTQLHKCIAEKMIVNILNHFLLLSSYFKAVIIWKFGGSFGLHGVVFTNEPNDLHRLLGFLAADVEVGLHKVADESKMPCW